MPEEFSQTGDLVTVTSHGHQPNGRNGTVTLVHGHPYYQVTFEDSTVRDSIDAASIKKQDLTITIILEESIGLTTDLRIRYGSTVRELKASLLLFLDPTGELCLDNLCLSLHPSGCVGLLPDHVRLSKQHQSLYLCESLTQNVGSVRKDAGSLAHDAVAEALAVPGTSSETMKGILMPVDGNSNAINTGRQQRVNFQMYAFFGAHEMGNSTHGPTDPWDVFGRVWPGSLFSVGPVTFPVDLALSSLQLVSMLMFIRVVTHGAPEHTALAGWSLGCHIAQTVAVLCSTRLASVRSVTLFEARSRAPFFAQPLVHRHLREHHANISRPSEKPPVHGTHAFGGIGTSVFELRRLKLWLGQNPSCALTFDMTLELQSPVGDTDANFNLQQDPVFHEHCDIYSSAGLSLEYPDSDHFLIGTQCAWDVARRVRCVSIAGAPVLGQHSPALVMQEPVHREHTFCDILQLPEVKAWWSALLEKEGHRSALLLERERLEMEKELESVALLEKQKDSDMNMKNVDDLVKEFLGLRASALASAMLQNDVSETSATSGSEYDDSSET